MRLGALFILLLLASPPAAAQEPSAPGAGEAREEVPPGKRVASINVEGVRRAEPAAVLGAMHTRVGAALDPATLREDIRRIYQLGFFSDVRVDGEDVPGGIAVTVVVQEKPAIRQVRVEGNDEISTEDLTKEIDVKPYQILDRAAVRRNAQKITQKYVEKGFYLAEVDPTITELPGNQVDVVFTVREHAKVMVKSITFLGNEKISDDQLRAAMLTQVGDFLSFLTSSGTYRADVFQRDVQAAMGVYYDYGYINARFGKPTVALTPDKQFLYITIPVEEGEQYTIGTLGFSGDLIEPEAQLRAQLSTASGKIFSRTDVQHDIQSLTDLYQDRAYAFVNVTPLTSVNTEKRTVDLTYDIQKGKQVRWERIEVVGNDKTRDKVIRRELHIHEGELYNGSALRASKARVTALGFFEPDPRTGSVEITTRKGSADDLIVGVVEVKEKPTGTFQLGAGFSSVENFIGTAQIAQNNFFGWGQSVSLSAQISSLRQLIQLQFVEPYLLDTDWTFAFNFFRTSLDYGDFTREATGGDLTFGHPLPVTFSEDLRLFLTYTLEDVNIIPSNTANPVLVFNEFQSGVTSSLRLTLNWDTRNNRLFPSRGFTQSVSVERAAPWLASTFDFTRYTAVSRWYFELPFKMVFKVQGTLGYMTGPNVESLLSEKYFLGGINSVRGYALRTISPTFQAAQQAQPDSRLAPFPDGGTKQLIINNELEFPIFDKIGIRGVVFWDFGNTYDAGVPFFKDPQHNLPLGLFNSVGFGFRWFSPIGPLRFEWGIPLEPRPQDQSILFEFTIGNSF